MNNREKLFDDIYGCSISEFQKHIESQWKPTMTWDNYGGGLGGGSWTFAYRLSVSDAAISDEDFLARFHFSNIYPASCGKNQFSNTPTLSTAEDVVISSIRNRFVDRRTQRGDPHINNVSFDDICGCSMKFFINYIEKQWTAGMSWSNHKSGVWCFRFKLPITGNAADTMADEDFHRRFYYKNIIVKGKEKDAGDEAIKKLRTSFRQACINRKIPRDSAAFVDIFGCSEPDLREYMEKQFGGAINWENYGKKGIWCWSYKLPVVGPTAASISDDEFRKRWHYTNIYPALFKSQQKK
jgi:hypothetical protein